MSLTWTSLAIVFALFFFLRSLNWARSTKSKRLPPGPKGFPIFGCIHLLGKFPHRDFHQLSKKYGSIMFLRLGFIPTIVVSSPQAAEQFLKTHDLVFANRPLLLTSTSKHINYGQKNLSLAQHGSYWRTVRKMCTLELLTSVKINSFQGTRKEELNLLIESIKAGAAAGLAVDLSSKVSSLNAEMSCRMVFGKKYADEELDERGFKAMIQEVMVSLATPNLGDYIPQIASLDLQGLTKRMKAVSKVFDAFFEKIIDEYVQFKDEKITKDFVDVMLSFLGSEETEYKIDREHIKAIILVTFV
ncbi:hypothetical protein Pint_26784 [Pistacia integerrima]|uniref:Uncharacterized protein n=1 Tax=Pistacia integerrima TaxID=434235 RepID=A0ACC0YR50_9ROSI|nr:hypothetical protein Pint_26784 [Pistacia integerrima]